MLRNGATSTLDPEALECLRDIVTAVERHLHMPLTEAAKRKSTLRAAEHIGVKLLWRRGECALVIANDSEPLVDVLGASKWTGWHSQAGGAVRAWAAFLRELPGAAAHGPLWFTSHKCRGTLVPFKLLDRLEPASA